MVKARRNRIKRSGGDFLFDLIVKLLLLVILAVVAYPLIYVVSASFSSPNDIFAGKVWLFPLHPTTLGYRTIFKDPAIVRSFLNSVGLVVVGTSVNLCLTVMMAYPLSVRDFFGRNAIMVILTITMVFSGGLVPLFLLVRDLGLYKSYAALILVPTGGLSVFNVIVARTFFQSSIPYELYEAAALDGCSDIYYLFRIVLPLAAPILAVLTLYYAVGHWNTYFYHMIFLGDAKEKFTFPLVLRNILIRNQTSTMISGVSVSQSMALSELLKYSLIVVSSLPMLLLYPFIQRHFVKGVMVGAIKG